MGMTFGSNNTNIDSPIENARVLFEVCCKVNFKRQFYFQFFNFKKKTLILWTFLSVMMILAFISEPSVFRLLHVLLFCLFPLLVISFSALNEVLSCEDIPDVYTFYPDRIENSDFRGNTSAYYNEIKSANEMEDFFYINVRKNIWCIIDKDKFTIGNPDDMRIFLEEQLGSRFKIKTKGNNSYENNR